MPSIEEMVQALRGEALPQVLSDASPDPVMPWQQYAGPKATYNPMQGFNPIIPDPNALVGSIAGPVTAGRLPQPSPQLGLKRRNWSPEEIDLVKSHFSKADLVGLPKIPGRTQQAVANKANELGLRLPSREPWTGSYQQTKPPDTGLPVHSPVYKKTQPSPAEEMVEALKGQSKSQTMTPPPALEQTLTEYARGNLNASGVQKIFKEHGWSVDLRRGKYDFEAFDPTGKAHYLTP